MKMILEGTTAELAAFGQAFNIGCMTEFASADGVTHPCTIELKAVSSKKEAAKNALQQFISQQSNAELDPLELMQNLAADANHETAGCRRRP